MNKRQRKKRDKKRQRAWNSIGDACADYIKFMLRQPSLFVLNEASVIVLPLEEPFETSMDFDGVVHRTGMYPRRQDGVTWCTYFCAPDEAIVGRGDPETPVTCLACAAS